MEAASTRPEATAESGTCSTAATPASPSCSSEGSSRQLSDTTSGCCPPPPLGAGEWAILDGSASAWGARIGNGKRGRGCGVGFGPGLPAPDGVRGFAFALGRGERGEGLPVSER